MPRAGTTISTGWSGRPPMVTPEPTSGRPRHRSSIRSPPPKRRWPSASSSCAVVAEADYHQRDGLHRVRRHPAGRSPDRFGHVPRHRRGRRLRPRRADGPGGAGRRGGAGHAGGLACPRPGRRGQGRRARDARRCRPGHPVDRVPGPRVGLRPGHRPAGVVSDQVAQHVLGVARQIITPEVRGGGASPTRSTPGRTPVSSTGSSPSPAGPFNPLHSPHRGNHADTHLLRPGHAELGRSPDQRPGRREGVLRRPVRLDLR